MTLKCPKCESPVYAIQGLCTDRDGTRNDQFCPTCEARYGLRSHGLVFISNGLNDCEILNETETLKQKIATLMNIDESVSKTIYPSISVDKSPTVEELSFNSKNELLCPECLIELHAINNFSTDSDAEYEDQFCSECETHYSIEKDGLVKISQSYRNSSAAQEKTVFKKAIAIMEKIKEDVAEKALP